MSVRSDLLLQLLPLPLPRGLSDAAKSNGAKDKDVDWCKPTGLAAGRALCT